MVVGVAESCAAARASFSWSGVRGAIAMCWRPVCVWVDVCVWRVCVGGARTVPCHVYNICTSIHR